MRWTWAWLLVLVLALPSAAELPGAGEAGVSEEELSLAVRQGRLGEDELIRRGEELSYFTRLKLYLYSRELEPYFAGVEERIRDLARVRPGDRLAVELARARLYDALRRSRRRLLAAGREEPAADWRRGLLGLIWLDQDWRRRVREQGKDEIRNPYDLVALMDCLDARLRGLAPGPIAGCPARAEEQGP
jgi:hypothetical protein